MGKSVIIIDTPQRCIDCPFSDDDYIGLCCNVYTYKNISLNAAMAGKPDWCPLQELPEPKAEVCMDKDFSEGFMHDVADLLEYCAENNTDNVDLIFTFGDKELNVNVTFSIKQN